MMRSLSNPRTSRSAVRLLAIAAIWLSLFLGQTAPASGQSPDRFGVGRSSKQARPNAVATRRDATAATESAAVRPQPQPQAAGNDPKSLPPAQWIWLPGVEQGQVPTGDAYFRKTIQLPKVPKARIQIAADDAYEVYINGRRVGTGSGPQTLSTHDCTSMIFGGDNLIAVRVSNRSGRTAAVLARFYVQLEGGQWRGMGTTTTWACSDRLQAGWQLNEFDDSRWAKATVASESPAGPSAPVESQPSIARNTPPAESPQVVATPASDRSSRNRFETASNRAAAVGTPAARNSATPAAPSATPPAAATAAKPASLASTVTKSGSDLSKRFRTQSGFVVEQVVDEIDSGSVLAMAFNEFGHIIASQEGGPLLLIYEAGKSKKTQRVRTYCDSVRNIQGILPLNGDVFVTGEGPQGPGLYRLIDANRDGQLEESQLVFAVKGSNGEHGAHQLALGPDGMLYTVLGNHVQIDAAISPSSPYRFTYEGDLVQPRREDPSGHAAGVKAPGGTVIRVDLRGGGIDIVAGGLRNAYDLAFHPTHGLYVQDSDMEADIGTTWHRSTNLFRITEGGEYGWRSGWAAWPDYYLDRLPALADTGRGSPTGAAFYDHYKFPAEYHEQLFLADWANGRIIAVDVRQQKDGTLKPAREFVSGTPMNVTDLDVGPDGSLYFSTGGRGTGGGIYRVRWEGEPMLQDSQLGTGIAKAIRQPQLASAWGRQAIAMQKSELGEQWDELIAGVAFSPDNPARYRMRALDLMQLVGPVPGLPLLIDLSRTPSEPLRAKVASQLAFYSEEPEAIERLTAMLRDSSPAVQQAAAEALVRTDHACDPALLRGLLASDNRQLQFLARRLLLRTPAAGWSESLLSSDDPELVLHGALASAIADASPENGEAILDRLHKLLDRYLSDAQFVDLLRVYQVVLHLHEASPEQLAEVSSMVTREFPAGEPIINRELVRLAAHTKNAEIVSRVIDYTADERVDISERLHVAMYVCGYHSEWDAAERTALLRFFEDAQRTEGGKSYSLYIMQASQQLGQRMTEQEAVSFLKDGLRYPNAALAGLPKLPQRLDDDLYAAIVQLDVQIDRQGFEEDVYKRLKTGFTAILASSGDERSMAYLRKVWRRSPDRRASVVLGLAQQPAGENWDYIVRSLNVVEPYATAEVLSQLKTVPVATEDAAAVRQTILHAIKMQKRGETPTPALELLAYWHGDDVAASESAADAKIEAWQKWFGLTYPDQPDPQLPDERDSRWSVDSLQQYFVSDQGSHGSKAAGKEIFASAQCSSCHRFDGGGSSLGPDLTNVASRFTQREVLESIMHPSQVISDQYACSKVLTVDGRVLIGLVSRPDESSLSITAAAGATQTLAADEVEELLPSRTSMMPSGLMDHLTQPQIRDLMCYMGLLPEAPADAEASQLAEAGGRQTQRPTR